MILHKKSKTKLEQLGDTTESKEITSELEGSLESSKNNSTQVESAETPKTELEQLRDAAKSKEDKLNELKLFMAQMEANMLRVKALIVELETEKYETKTGPDAQ